MSAGSGLGGRGIVQFFLAVDWLSGRLCSILFGGGLGGRGVMQYSFRRWIG